MYQYKIVTLTGNNEETLNRLGMEGWELVSVTPDSDTDYTTPYLKRQFPTTAKWVVREC